MPKEGIVFDYDLRANEHLKPGAVCEICGAALWCRWTDRHGEGVCLTCGAPYQILQYGEDDKLMDLPPKLNLKPECIPVVKAYWAETKRFVFYGTSINETTGLREFADWVKAKHPEMLKPEKPREDPVAMEEG